MSEPSGPGELIAVGRITGAHGLRGEVSILPLSEVATRFDAGSRLLIGEHGAKAITVVSRRTHRGRPLVRFEGVGDRDAAQALRGAYLYVLPIDAPDLPPDAFWPHLLVGCEVVTEGGRELGRFREVLHTPANDIWAVDGLEGELLVPALRDVVRSVDLQARRIVVAEVPGLTIPVEEGG